MALASVATLATAACSSKLGDPPTDSTHAGAVDAASPDVAVVPASDAAAPTLDASPPPPNRDAEFAPPDKDASPSSSSFLYDGTVGQPCSTDGDCQPSGHPSLAQCTATVFAGTGGPYDPTSVCIIVPCDPGTDGQLHYCDGPDDPSSPGVCLPNGSGAGNGETGICLPQCTFAPDGTPPTGCAGKDVCNAYTVRSGASGPVGVGYCFGGCAQDGDCPSGSKCQVDDALCVAKPTLPTKTLGAACTYADEISGACHCEYGAADTGYCSSVCVVGGAACPTGWVCESFEPAPTFAKPTPGIAGVCAPGCNVGGAACPAGAICQSTYVAGPDCLVP